MGSRAQEAVRDGLHVYIYVGKLLCKLRRATAQVAQCTDAWRKHFSATVFENARIRAARFGTEVAMCRVNQYTCMRRARVYFEIAPWLSKGL